MFGNFLALLLHTTLTCLCHTQSRTRVYSFTHASFVLFLTLFYIIFHTNCSSCGSHFWKLPLHFLPWGLQVTCCQVSHNPVRAVNIFSAELRWTWWKALHGYWGASSCGEEIHGFHPCPLALARNKYAFSHPICASTFQHPCHLSHFSRSPTNTVSPVAKSMQATSHFP